MLTQNPLFGHLLIRRDDTQSISLYNTGSSALASTESIMTAEAEATASAAGAVGAGAGADGTDSPGRGSDEPNVRIRHQ